MSPIYLSTYNLFEPFALSESKGANVNLSALFTIFVLFLCWGSFLSATAYRIIFDKKFSLTKRSSCPACSKIINWYDLIPLVSFLILGGKCRHCSKKISYLYPFIELLTAISLTLLLIFQAKYFFGYFIFFSLLIICVRTDLESMLISRVFSLFMVPLGWTLAYLQILPLNLKFSIIGAIFGFAILYIFNFVFKLITKKDGMGLGDMDLLALIGAFLGPFGAWATLLIGSVTGSILGVILILLKKTSRDQRIPFGPFLAISAMLVTIFSAWIPF